MASQVSTDKIASRSSGIAFTLPTADGTANQHLKTDGSGALGWATPPTGVALTGATNTWIPTITGADALTGTANFTYDGNVLDVKNSGTASSINLYCETGNAHYIKIKSGPHASATSYTLTMPNAPPSVSGQLLSATTAGVASWARSGGVTAVFSVFKTPALIALIPALVFNITDVEVPIFLSRLSGLLGQAMIPVMLITLGVQMGEITKIMINFNVFAASTVRLIGGPVLALLIVPYFGLEGLERSTGILQAAMPAAVLASIIALEYKLLPEFVTTTVLFSTIYSILTLTVILTFI